MTAGRAADEHRQRMTDARERDAWELTVADVRRRLAKIERGEWWAPEQTVRVLRRLVDGEASR